MIRGDRIKQLRLSKNLTHTELGKLVNVTKTSICGYERNYKTPNLDTLVILCEVLGVKIDYIMGNEINIVAENEEPYNFRMSSEEILLIKELRKNGKLYNKIIKEPKRAIELINIKIN